MSRSCDIRFCSGRGRSGPGDYGGWKLVPGNCPGKNAVGTLQDCPVRAGADRRSRTAGRVPQVADRRSSAVPGIVPEKRRRQKADCPGPSWGRTAGPRRSQGIAPGNAEGGLPRAELELGGPRGIAGIAPGNAEGGLPRAELGADRRSSAVPGYCPGKGRRRIASGRAGARLSSVVPGKTGGGFPRAGAWALSRPWGCGRWRRRWLRARRGRVRVSRRVWAGSAGRRAWLRRCGRW